MNARVLYHDSHYIAAEKPSGLLVHPYWKETNEKECLLKELKRQTGLWLYPVHRLDRPVSGVVLFALSSEAGKRIQEIWRDGSTRKLYSALAKGAHTGTMRFDLPLGNEKKIPQEALTLARPLEVFELEKTQATLLEVEIKTGRKHQIRRHFSRCRAQLVGDRMYGKKPLNDFFKNRYGVERLFLHAKRLEFIHPYTDKIVCIESPLPPDLEQALAKIREERKA